MSCSCRPELESEARDEPWVELRGVKKRVKRLGVIGGGLFCLRAPVSAGGEEEKSSGVGSWSATRGAQGEDMAESGAISYCTCIYREMTANVAATRRHAARRAGLRTTTWDGRTL